MIKIKMILVTQNRRMEGIFFLLIFVFISSKYLFCNENHTEYSMSIIFFEVILPKRCLNNILDILLPGVKYRLELLNQSEHHFPVQF